MKMLLTVMVIFITFWCKADEDAEFYDIIKSLSSEDAKIRKEGQSAISHFSNGEKYELYKLLAADNDPELRSVADFLNKSMPEPYRVFKKGLSSGNCGETGLITSEKELAAYVKSGKCSEKLKEFFQTADFEEENILVYKFMHEGSGQDRSTLKFKYSDGVLQYKIFDSNTSKKRTLDKRRKEYYFALIFNKYRVKCINVKDRMGKTEGRKFYPVLEDKFNLNFSYRIIEGFAAYQGWSRQKLLNAEKLSFRGYDLSLRDYKAIRLLPKLKHLDLSMTNVTPEKLEIIRSHSGINSINFAGEYDSRFDAACLNALSRSNLKVLDLSCARLGEEGLNMLKEFTNLQKLTLHERWTAKERPADKLELLCNISSLRELSLTSSNIPFAFFDELPKLNRLEKLTIMFKGKKPQDWDECIASLGEADLSYLDIGGQYLSDENMKEIAKLSYLEDLYVRGFNRVTDTGISYLKPLTRVQNLSLGYCKINGSGLRGLKHFPLKKLDLRSTEIGNDTLKFIADSYQGLEQLNLRYTRNITKDALPLLGEISSLKYLHVFKSFVGMNYGQLKDQLHSYELFVGDKPFAK